MLEGIIYVGQNVGATRERFSGGSLRFPRHLLSRPIGWDFFGRQVASSATAADLGRPPTKNDWPISLPEEASRVARQKATLVDQFRSLASLYSNFNSVSSSERGRPDCRPIRLAKTTATMRPD